MGNRCLPLIEQKNSDGLKIFEVLVVADQLERQSSVRRCRRSDGNWALDENRCPDF